MRAIEIAFAGLLAGTAAAEPPIMAIRQDPRAVDVGMGAADAVGRTYRLRLELTGVQVEATPAR